ncbi:unnamed protein product, partial [Sphenostylis stenocarpa]
MVGSQILETGGIKILSRRPVRKISIERLSYDLKEKKESISVCQPKLSKEDVARFRYVVLLTDFIVNNLKTKLLGKLEQSIVDIQLNPIEISNAFGDCSAHEVTSAK